MTSSQIRIFFYARANDTLLVHIHQSIILLLVQIAGMPGCVLQHSKVYSADCRDARSRSSRPTATANCSCWPPCKNAPLHTHTSKTKNCILILQKQIKECPITYSFFKNKLKYLRKFVRNAQIYLIPVSFYIFWDVCQRSKGSQCMFCCEWWSGYYHQGTIAHSKGYNVSQNGRTGSQHDLIGSQNCSRP